MYYSPGLLLFIIEEKVPFLLLKHCVLYTIQKSLLHYYSKLTQLKIKSKTAHMYVHILIPALIIIYNRKSTYAHENT